MRSDYIDDLPRLNLPTIHDGVNLKWVGPFIEPVAQDFLARSGLNLGPELIATVVRHASDLDGQAQALGTNQIAVLTSTQVAALTTDDIGVLSTAQSAVLGTAGLSSAQVAVLPTADVTGFSSAQLAALSTAALPGSHLN